MDQHSVPFPSVEDGDVSSDKCCPADSHGSTSSQSTSSDKLTALPFPVSSPNLSRATRSNSFSVANTTRVLHPSVTAAASLPSFGATDWDSSRMNKGTPLIPNSNPDMNDGGSPCIGTCENGSPAKETSRQKVSFDSDRASLPTIHHTGLSPLTRSRQSDIVIMTPALRSSAYIDHRDTAALQSESRTSSKSRSRAASPLRLIQQWSSGLHRHHRVVPEERFVPVDPFKWPQPRPCDICISTQGDVERCDPNTVPCKHMLRSSSVKVFLDNAHIFITDTLPLQIYLNFLLQLPAMYFSRVARVFEDAEVSRPDIQRIIEEEGGRFGTFTRHALSEHASVHRDSQGGQPHTLAHISAPSARSAGMCSTAAQSFTHLPLPCPDDWTPAVVSHTLIRFKHSWEAFIDSLIREWKTLNVVSALLASTILTILQVPQASEDAVTRTIALVSLVCALMSLSYGCVFIVRFGTMRSMYRASRWAEEARKDNTFIWWNVWVLLAMPAVWMAWSMLCFIVAILSFVWRTGSVDSPVQREHLGPKAIFGPRVIITLVVFLGIMYFFLIVKTLRRYGSHEDMTDVPKTRADEQSAGGDPLETCNQATTKVVVDAMSERRGRDQQRDQNDANRGEKGGECETGITEKSTSVMNVDGDGDEKLGAASALGLGLTGVHSRDASIGFRFEQVEVEGEVTTAA